MEISMFGPLVVRDGDRVLGPGDLGGVKPRQVLELLLLARGHLVSTDVIADALWPEGQEPRNIVATLNTYVCVLRQNMFLDRVQARRVIVTGSGAYRLSLDEVSVDLDRFDDLVLGAERATRADRLGLLTAAVALASGAVLEHARYDEWVQEERLVYTDRTTRAHLDLARDWLAEGGLAPGLRHAELALGLARYSEEAFRLIMLANHGLGHHDIVRRTLERCRATLDRDLGVDCGPETEEMARAIEARLTVAEVLARFYPPSSERVPAARDRSVA
jgi:DNA-binding SARP family transcriptional activator